MAKKGDISKGSETRQLILDRALKIAAREGLAALSIGRLAKELRMSKSGLFVHFGSKEKLEREVVEQASLLFFDRILLPIEEAGLEGIERVWALCDSWLDFVEQEVLPGGYFFTGAFFGCAGRSGPIAAQIQRMAREWLDTVQGALHQARKRGEIRVTIDLRRSALELNAILLGAQWSQLMTHRDQINARSAILARLRSLASEEIPNRAFESVGAWKRYLKRR